MHLEKSIISPAPITCKLEIAGDITRHGYSGGVSTCKCQASFVIPREAYMGMRTNFNGMINELPQGIGIRIRMGVFKFNNGYVPAEIREKYYQIRITASDYESGMHQDFISAISSISDRLITKLNEEGYAAIKASLRKDGEH